MKRKDNPSQFSFQTVTLFRALIPTLVSACSVLSGALRYAWLMSLKGRGMYCKVKLLRAEQKKRKEQRKGGVIEGGNDGLKGENKVGYTCKG